jgi:ankyrin repeat protein
LPKDSVELPELDSVSRVERNPNLAGVVADAVETKATSWLAAALLVGGYPNEVMIDGDGDGVNLLIYAASLGYEDIVRFLLQFGADPKESDALAAAVEYPDIVALLLEKGADPNEVWVSSSSSPLARAARAKNVESLRMILACGGDPNRVCHLGGNVLHAALQNTNAECCRELLAYGADPCARSQHWFCEQTPMHVVARHDNGRDGWERVKILDLLLDAGASVTAVDGAGLTPGEVVRQCHGASKEVLEWFCQHEAV